MTDSQTLLADYVQSGSDAAFRELVTRYVDLVYSTALRLVDGDSHQAEDVAQTVFVDLARTARTLSGEVKLGGWLHRHTCFVAAKTMRGERRRQSRERQAVEMNALQDNSEANFSLVGPILDEAINELGEADRTAILLRFFEQQDFRSVGAAIGSNEDAARMRVMRALEKLQELLTRHGVTTSAGALSVALSAHVVQAAPAGLAFTIATAAALAGTTIVTTTTTAAAAKAIAMTTLQKSLIAAALVAAVGTGVYQARQSSTLRTEIQSLQRQQASLSEQNRQLASERDEATRQQAALRAENQRANGNAELLRLRGEVGILRRQNQSLAQANVALANAHETQTLNKGFGTLGEYLALEKVSDAGNSTAEALLQTFVWAMREGKAERLEQIGAPFGGQSKPGEVVGEVPESEAAVFKTVQNVFTNSAGFRLSSMLADDGRRYEVRLEAVPLPDRQDGFMKNINLSFFLEQKADRWSFGNPVEESAPKSK